MKDLRPPTCRTHSIVHIHATYTHLHTRIRYMCIYHACPTHIGRHTRSILFGDVMICHGICLQVFNEKKAAAYLSSLNASLRIHTIHEHTRARTHTNIHARKKHTDLRHRVLLHFSSSHPPVSTAMALYS